MLQCGFGPDPGADLLLLVKLLVGLARGNVELVLGLGLGRLEGAREDAHARVLDGLGHLRVGEVLVHNDAAHQLSLVKAPAGLALHLDQVKVHVMPVQIGHRQDRLHSNLIETVPENNQQQQKKKGGRKGKG